MATAGQSTLDMENLGTQVAKHLGPGWSLDPQQPASGHRVTLRNLGVDRHFGFALRHQARDKRIEILADWPTSDDGNSYPYGFPRSPVTITVGEARGPSAIAREIARRVLPTYSVAFAKGVRQRDDHDASEARRELDAHEGLMARINDAARALVLARWPGADAWQNPSGQWLVKTSPIASAPVGRGDSEGDAWHRAARYLTETGKLFILDYK